MSSKKEKFTDLINKNRNLVRGKNPPPPLEDEFDNSGNLITNKISKKFVPGHYKEKIGESEFILHKENTFYQTIAANHCISPEDTRNYNNFNISIDSSGKGYTTGIDSTAVITPYIPNAYNDPGFYVRDNGELNQWGTLAGNPITVDDLERLQKNIHYPNKVDKDLIDGKLPYNIKKDLDNTLYYEIAVAGYDLNHIKIEIVKDGVEIKLLEDHEDDLIGDEFEYLCRGISLKNQEQTIFIDSSLYDIDNLESFIKNGILTLKVEPKKAKKIKIVDLD